MGIKLYGCTFVGNDVAISVTDEVEITCMNCGHTETAEGVMQGDPICPKCGSRRISIVSNKQQEKK